MKTVSKCLKACPIYCSLAIGPPSNFLVSPLSSSITRNVPHLVKQFKATLPKYLLSFKQTKRRKCLNVYHRGHVVSAIEILCNKDNILGNSQGYQPSLILTHLNRFPLFYPLFCTNRAKDLQNDLYEVLRQQCLCANKTNLIPNAMVHAQSPLILRQTISPNGP